MREVCASFVVWVAFVTLVAIVLAESQNWDLPDPYHVVARQQQEMQKNWAESLKTSK